MKLKVFSVFDSKVGAYLTPFFSRSTGEAIRAFTQAANDSQTQFCKFAEDFTLFEIGEWDDQNSKFELLASHVSLGKAIEFIHRDVHPAQLSLVKES